MALTPSKIADSIAIGKLTPELSESIFDRVLNTSAIARVAGKAEVSLTGTNFLIDAGKVEASVINEGGAIGTTNLARSWVSATPLKVGAAITWSKEWAEKNPAGVQNLIESKLVEAINEQLDAAIIYGKSVANNQQVANLPYLNQATNRVELGSGAAAKGGISADIIAGYDRVISAGNRFTGFVASPSMRTQLFGATDTTGRPIFTDAVNLADDMGMVMGLPMAYSPAVSGQFGTGKADTKVRAIGGDFANSLKLGFAKDIEISYSDSASIGGVSLWENDLEGVKVTATFGFAIANLGAFVVYEDKVA